ncbi:uncharacterized protein LOC100679949 [Nasonia vitripennis]|uniref:THAP-type domain-containing protein n=1 Tax=Nasonia vitripennis TaxID=7425 RepID=A0A7M7GCF3_NASVI|nr:uncharacterized protein LOC100679949 [Nasonia vitripennis]
MPGCAAIGCNNRSEKGYTMKCFPRDPVLRKIWKQRVGRADWEPSNNSFLCHVHFESNQWVVTPSGKIKLKKGALPSIFTVTSTRKSPKKRQKLGVPPVEVEEDEDLEEYEVEYLENDGPFIFNTSNQKIVPNIINVQTQNAAMSGQILQNVKFISNESLKNLQNEKFIIVADENNREIGKIISDSALLLFGNERGKENVHTLTKLDRPTPAEVKIEVKEETPDNGLSSHDYDEIERKLKEICHSENENETDNSNSIKNPKKISDQSIEIESTFSLEDLENGSDSVRENSSQDIDSDASSVRTGIKRKRKIKPESRDQKLNIIETSQSTSKSNESQFTEDVTDIIHDLETESLTDSNSQQLKHVSPVPKIKNTLTNGASKPIIKNDIQLKNDIVNRPAQIKKNNIVNVKNVKPNNELMAKLDIQGEVIEKLSNELIMYKDMERKMQSLTQELQNKNKEIEILMRKQMVKKPQVDKKVSKAESADLKDASEADLKQRIDFLEDNNKKLMKTVTLEGQNRRKLECQVKSRDNQIKELNWKLEKASKFLDRAEKNANNYRKKMLNMQALLRRRKLQNEKSSIFDEFLVCHSDQNFSESALEIALEIEKACGPEGYQKLLHYEFPVPTLKNLSKKYPTEIDFNDPDEEVIFETKEPEQHTNDISAAEIKMENVEYLDPDFLAELDETVTGTVQDIFEESSDSDDLNLTELQKHIMIDFS